MQSIDSHFIGNFKDGDNICYNLNVLRALYEAKDCEAIRSPSYLNKPQIILIVSVIEAALDDLIYKIRKYTNEGVPNIPDEVNVKVRRNVKSYRKFENYISLAAKYDFFDVEGTNFYTRLDELRKIRNRIHIQNSKQYQPLSEMGVFTQANLTLAEKICEYTLKKMSSKFPRNYTARNYVEDFELPWEPHYPDFN